MPSYPSSKRIISLNKGYEGIMMVLGQGLVGMIAETLSRFGFCRTSIYGHLHYAV